MRMIYIRRKTVASSRPATIGAVAADLCFVRKAAVWNNGAHIMIYEPINDSQESKAMYRFVTQVRVCLGSGSFNPSIIG